MQPHGFVAHCRHAPSDAHRAVLGGGGDGADGGGVSSGGASSGGGGSSGGYGGGASTGGEDSDDDDVLLEGDVGAQLATADELICPIRMGPMRSPVRTSDGHAYDRAAIPAVSFSTRRQETDGKSFYSTSMCP